MEIAYLTYKETDKKKWDDCIRNSSNRLIYAYSFYLDAMAGNWDALVLNDYEAVMPLTWKQKWGIKYLYQPAFTQQGGIFFTRALTEIQLKSFIEKILLHFKFAEITLNFANKNIDAGKNIEITERNNFLLNLSHSYEKLYDNYQPAFTKSLRRIKKFGLRYSASPDYKNTINLYKELYGKRMPSLKNKNYLQFEKLCEQLSAENNVLVRHAYNEKNLVAAVILLKDKDRLYNIISCITIEGKKLEANYFLYDNIIHEFAGSRLLLDLEGSDVEGIAGFYKKFNPENQPYSFIRFNNLPLVAKIFKP